MPDSVPVQIHALSRRYGAKLALDGVTLEVPRGKVFGLLGENGAGKTTLIRHIMGLLNAQTGTVRVFGKDPVRDPEGALAHIGYLSEDRDLPRWMRIHEFLRYSQGFYPKWDDTFAEQLLDTFELDLTQKIKTLSMGQTAKIGLVAALAHRPDLVILDEPSSGLDAVVRRHILDSAIRRVAAEGHTVLFSSHLLDEVERVADTIAIMHGGRVLLCDSLDNLRAAHRGFTVSFDPARPAMPGIPGVLSWEGTASLKRIVCAGGGAELKAALPSLGGKIVEEGPATLEEIFMARVGAKFYAAANS
ncbi:MAG: ABC transporter ATP-binding protein [Candidatus Hydrogenedentota bacterium]